METSEEEVKRTEDRSWMNENYASQKSNIHINESYYENEAGSVVEEYAYSSSQSFQPLSSTNSALSSSSNEDYSLMSSAGRFSTHAKDSKNQMKVVVSEPVKQGEGMHAYISYKVTTTTNRPEFTKNMFTVIRRYSDFVFLHQSLAAGYPGVIIPPLPEKPVLPNIVGRFSSEFIENRRKGLQVFLLRACSHPELQHSEHLKVFLEANEETMMNFKSDKSKTASKSQSRGGIFQWIDETVHQISTSLGSSTVEKNAKDYEFDEIVAYVDSLENLMGGLFKHTQMLTKRAKEISDGLFDFGVSFTLLGQAEDHESLNKALNTIGKCATDRLSVLAAEHAEKEKIYFEEPIMDYIALIGAVKQALYKRNELMLSYQTARSDCEHKQNLYEKLKSKNPSDDKTIQAEMELRKAEETLDDMKQEYDLVSERVLREVERFKLEKLVDFKRIILDYIQVQIEYNKKMEAEWEKIIPILENLDDSTLTSSPSSSS